MSKNVKKFIASALLVTSFLAAGTFDKYGINNIAAYGVTTYDDAEDGQLKSIKITKSNGNEMDLVDKYTDKILELTSSKTYYINLKSGIEGFYIDAEAEGDGYITKIFTSSSKTAEGKDSDDYIKVDSGTSFVYIRVYKSEEAYDKAYDNGDVTKCEATYKFCFNKKEAISEEEEDADMAYLRGIKLSSGDLQFVKTKTSYDVNVDEDVSEIEVKVKVEDEDDLIEIQGKQVEKDDNYASTVKLKKGNNEIKINVQSDDDEKTYTLNVYRGKKSSTDSKNDVIIISGNTGSTSEGWVSSKGKWMYNDINGNPIKNQWHIDNSGINYYLDEDSYMVTGWKQIQNKWYYFDNSGAMKTGWNLCNGKWYYMDKSGVMKTGWVKDNAWYYLSNDGSMKTGWLAQGGYWYYLNSDGSMVTGTRYIDGQNYNFNSSGQLL